MVSTCPSCLTQITHDDLSLEVECTCGMKFNPFATAEDLPPMEPSLDDSDPADFTESSSVFADLVDFGENLSNVPAASAKAEQKAPIATPAAPERTDASAGIAVVRPPGDSSVLLSSASDFPGHRIDDQLGMISAAKAFDAASDDPLADVFEALKVKAQALGGNAVLNVRWWLSPDAGRAVASGTALRISK